MTTATVKRRFDSHGIPQSVALCTPATRMVAVEAWSNDGEASHAVYPVLALEVRLEATFSRTHRPGDHRRPPTPDAAEASGWGHEGTGTEYDVVVMTEEFGLCSASLAFAACNAAYRVVVADWPPEEDVERLAGVAAEVRAEAVEKEARGRRSAAGVAPDSPSSVSQGTMCNF
jgi:hypothetical protein